MSDTCASTSDVAAGASPADVTQALTWLAALHGGDAARAQAARAASQAWRQRKPRHEAAWAEAERRWAAVGSMLEPTPSLRDALPLKSGVTTRRALLAGAGGSAAAGLVAWLGLSGWRAPQYETALSTATAQHLNGAMLPDGTRVALAADSRVSVTYWRARRELHLAHGRIHLDVAHDAARPFVVLTRLGRVEVLGTAFSVADRGMALVVVVERGRVRVASGDAEVQLSGGEQVRVESEGVFGKVNGMPAMSGARGQAQNEPWSNGWWRFVDTPLAEAVAEVNAYTARRLAVAPGAAGLRITGSFRIDQPERFVEALPRVLPVRMVADASGQRRVEALR